ncbi:MAG: hypothetical protein IKD47_01490 [Clostridia bacterium]|nr:hypothetical protein [Clostridia bacterium]
MKALKRFWILLVSAVLAVACLAGCNVRYEGVYKLYSITQEVDGEEIVYNLDDVIPQASGEGLTLTKDCLTFDLKAPKDKKGVFTVSGVIYYGGKTASGVWEKSRNKKLKLTIETEDGKNETEEWWLVKCDGKTMTYEWEGSTLTLKKE